MAVMADSAQLSAALHCKHGGMDDRGDRPAALACVRPYSDFRGLLTAYRSRHQSLQSYWISRHVLGAFHFVDCPRLQLHSNGTEGASSSDNRPRCYGRLGGPMGTLWFWIVALMLVAYVVLDGFDLGVGIVYLFVAKSEQERQQALQAISPVWDGNE